MWSLSLSSPTVLGDQANMRIHNNLDGVSAQIDVRHSGSAQTEVKHSGSVQIDVKHAGSPRTDVKHFDIAGPRHENALVDIEAGMALTIGSDTPTVAKIFQYAIKLDRIYKADWFSMSLGRAYPHPLRRIS